MIRAICYRRTDVRTYLDYREASILKVSKIIVTRLFIPFQDDSTETPSENDGVNRDDYNDYGAGDETELPRSGKIVDIQFVYVMLP